MAESAKVSSLDALKDFKEALAKFGEQARQALDSAQGDIQRAINRLQHEQMAYWKQQEKHWHRRLQEAKTELNRVELQPRDQQPSAVIERKAVEKAQRHLQRAQEKQQRIKHWVRVLDREAMLCKGQLQQLDRMLESDLPNTQAMVERMLMELEQYVRTPAATAHRPAATDEHEAAPSMARPIDEAVPAVPADAEHGEVGAPDREARKSAPTIESWPEIPESAQLPERERERLARLIRGSEPLDFRQRIVLEPDAPARSSLILLRMLEPPRNDSGWFLGTDERHAPASSAIRSTTVGDLVQRRPDLESALRLPPGTMIVIRNGRVAGVYDTRDADAREDEPDVSGA